jgi:hypothetical protein
MPKLNWTAPVIPPRLPGWENALAATMQRHMALPISYGTSDCLLQIADVCLAMTGVDPMRRLRRYRTETGALRIMAALGFGDVEQALAAVFPRIDGVGNALRGDAGIVERLVDGHLVLSAVVIIGHMAVGKDDFGHAPVSTLALKSAFAIGAR